MEQEDESEFDPVTGLRQKTNYGRPDWTKLFSEFSKTHNGRTNGVFVCGPKVISTQLRENCVQFTDRSTKFVFNKENFVTDVAEESIQKVGRRIRLTSEHLRQDREK
jgi:hypothetical protein